MNTLKTKVKNLEKKIPDATTLTNISQSNMDRQNLEKKGTMLIKNSGLVSTTVLISKISAGENKIQTLVN